MAVTRMATLEEMLDEAGLDVKGFSVVSTVSMSEIYKALRGDPVSLVTAQRFADALGIPRAQIHAIEGLQVKLPARRRRRAI